MRTLESPGSRPACSTTRIEPTGAGTETGRKAARQRLENQLRANLAELRSLYRKLAPAQAWLEGRIAFSDEAQRPDLEARKLELDRRAEEAARRIAQADADITALADPRSDASTCQEILARVSSTGRQTGAPERRLA